MARPAYPLSPEALEELRRFVDTGKRRHAVACAPSSPSVRDIAEHLFRRKLTAELVNPGIIWRACRRLGLALPGRCRTGKARARRRKPLLGTAGGPPILEMGRAA